MRFYCRFWSTLTILLHNVFATIVINFRVIRSNYMCNRVWILYFLQCKVKSYKLDRNGMVMHGNAFWRCMEMHWLKGTCTTIVERTWVQVLAFDDVTQWRPNGDIRLQRRVNVRIIFIHLGGKNPLFLISPHRKSFLKILSINVPFSIYFNPTTVHRCPIMCGFPQTF